MVVSGPKLNKLFERVAVFLVREARNLRMRLGSINLLILFRVFSTQLQHGLDASLTGRKLWKKLSIS
jgi:hypothetical protein